MQPVLDLYRGVAGPLGTLPAVERIEKAVDLVDHRSVRVEGEA